MLSAYSGHGGECADSNGVNDNYYSVRVAVVQYRSAVWRRFDVIDS